MRVTGHRNRAVIAPRQGRCDHARLPLISCRVDDRDRLHAAAEVVDALLHALRVGADVGGPVAERIEEAECGMPYRLLKVTQKVYVTPPCSSMVECSELNTTDGCEKPLKPS